MTMTLREEALKLHMDNNGKIAVVSKVPIAVMIWLLPIPRV